MTDRNLSSDIRPIMEQLAKLSHRIYELERRRPVDPQTQMLASLFSYPGPLLDNIESPPWHPDHAVTLIRTRLSVLTAGTGPVTVEVRMNGQPLYQITLSSGTSTSIPSNVFVAPEDYLTIITVATNDAQNMSLGFVPRV